MRKSKSKNAKPEAISIFASIHASHYSNDDLKKITKSLKERDMAKGKTKK